jgi:hypothetical protein
VLFLFGVRRNQSHPEELWGRAGFGDNSGNVESQVQQSGLKNLGVVMHTCNLSTWEAEAGGSRGPGQPGLYNEFKASLHHETVAKKGEGRAQRL